MPPPLLLDLETIEKDEVCATRADIYRKLPQRYEFEQMDGINHVDLANGLGVGFRDIRMEDWWVRGHIPGNPLFPGVLMLEAAAQCGAYLASLLRPDDRFMAFGGVDECKFRGAVVPPARMYFACKLLENRPRRFICHVQGIVKRELVFEAKITGLAMG